MRIACHISKKTARLLLHNGIVPYLDTGMKTHKYKIKKTAVIKYLKQRNKMPETFLLLKDSCELGRPPVITDDDSDAKPTNLVTFEEYPDILTTYQAAEMADTKPDTIMAWARKKYFFTFKMGMAYRIPKASFVEYLNSAHYKCKCIVKQNNMEKRKVTATTS